MHLSQNASRCDFVHLIWQTRQYFAAVHPHWKDVSMRTRTVLKSTLLLSLAVWCTACKSTSSAPASSETNSSQTSSRFIRSVLRPNSIRPTLRLRPHIPRSPTHPSPAHRSRSFTAQQPVEPTPPQPPSPAVIPAGTILRVRLVHPVGSKISVTGQSFDATFSSPVMVNGETVVPIGTRAFGTVTEAHASGRFKGGATLSLRLNSIRLNGATFAIRTALYDQTSTGKNDEPLRWVAESTGGGALDKRNGATECSSAASLAQAQVRSALLPPTATSHSIRDVSISE